MLISVSIPHKVFNRDSGEEEFQKLNYQVEVPEFFMELDPYILNSLLYKAFSWGLKSIELDPDWIQKCKLESSRNLDSLKRQKLKQISKFQEIQKKPKRTASEAFFLLSSESNSKNFDDMMRELY